MDGENRHGCPPRAHSTYRVRPAIKNLYEIGPLRLREHSLKTAQAYLSPENLRHNASLIKSYCRPSIKLCAVVKADAYGHHARSVVSALSAKAADCYAVASVEEAQQIYPFVAGKTILVTSPLFTGVGPDLIELAQARSFHCTVCSLNTLDYLKQFLNPEAPPLNLHLKIDTGMGRLGCDGAEAQMLICAINQNRLFNLAGVFTHFATADEPDLTFAYHQLGNFKKFLTQSGLDRDASVIKHAANTSATLRIPAAHFDMVRCGIGLYGYTNFPPSPVPPASRRQIPNSQSLNPKHQTSISNPQSPVPSP